jgi:hypothetical protein
MKRIALTLAVLASIGSVIQVDADDPLFVPASPVKVGRGSGEVVLADVNRDGHRDLITKHLLTRVVNVFLGDGRGRFAAAADGPMNFSYEPGAIVLEDVNGDGFLDLAVANKDAKKEYINVFLGKGNGGFSLAAGSPHTTGESFQFYKPIVRIGDINEDGKRDIVTANGRGDSIVLLLGDGQGKFSTGPVLKLDPGRELYTFDLGDVDADRHLDLVTATSRPGRNANRLVVKRGDGHGTFQDGASLPVPAGPRVEALADVNGDQHLDVVLSHAEKGRVSVLLNTGQGVFMPAAHSPYEIGREAFSVVVSDANRDKWADMFAATGNSVTVLLGNGRTFAPAPGSPFRAGSGAYNVAVGDINEDGKPDIVASSFEGDSVTVLMGR